MLTEPLTMLQPIELPSVERVGTWTASHLEEDRTWGNSLGGTSVGVSTMLAELRRLVRSPLLNEPSSVSLEGQAEDLAHDNYFHIQRGAGDACALFVRTAVTARLIFLQEIQDSLVTTPLTVLQTIDRSLADLAGCLMGPRSEAARYVTEWNLGGTIRSAMPRWVKGHQLFAALTQGLIFAFHALGQGLRSGQSGEVRRWTDLAISLLEGSGAVFGFTADFEVEDYINIVRPSMMPPLSEVALSGLMSVDHRLMVQVMRDMRPAIRSLAEQEPARHEALSKALSGVYDSHIHVCERFVGGRPSILTAGRTVRSGPSLIEQFKTLRLKPFEQVSRAPRLAPETATASGGKCPYHP